MDPEGPEANGCKLSPKAVEEAASKGEVGAGRGGDEEEEKESNSLLSPRNGRVPSSLMKKNPSRRKVQWNDRNGHKLVEVLEYQPSDTSDSEEDEESDSCFCTIM